VKRDVVEVATQMLDHGVAVGRAFPPMNTMLRVSIGSEAEMAKFKEAFPQVVKV